MKPEFKHIVVDEAGRAWVEGTRLKVSEVIEACQAYGWSPEDYHLQHPEIAIAQIRAALAYYDEYQVLMDSQIRDQASWASREYERNREETAALRDRVRRWRQGTA